MLKRKITDRLVAWKAAHGQECLLSVPSEAVGEGKYAFSLCGGRKTGHFA